MFNLKSVLGKNVFVKIFIFVIFINVKHYSVMVNVTHRVLSEISDRSSEVALKRIV